MTEMEIFRRPDWSQAAEWNAEAARYQAELRRQAEAERDALIAGLCRLQTDNQRLRERVALLERELSARSGYPY